MPFPTVGRRAHTSRRGDVTLVLPGRYVVHTILETAQVAQMSTNSAAWGGCVVWGGSVQDAVARNHLSDAWKTLPSPFGSYLDVTFDSV